MFLQKENLSTLWDVITEENIFKFLSKEIQVNVYQIFLNNIKEFFETERNKNNSLIDINKKYILLILNYIKTQFPEKIPNKIKILNQPNDIKELITYEEIQNDRTSQFEKELMKRKDEFTNAITSSIPQVPDFADKYTDKPISEMEQMIKDMTTQRNYEIEQINKTNEKNKSETEWLNPKETSIKAEKLTPNLLSSIKEFQEPKKNVTWMDNISFELNINETQSNETQSNDIQSNETKNNKINYLERQIDSLNKKVDQLFELLNKKLNVIDNE